MNCFAHALPFLDDPYFAVGTCMPDWMSMHDRKARVRERNAAKFADSQNEVLSRIARGVIQHHRDDHWFHIAPRFNELCLNFSNELKELHDGERGMRPGLLGHILIELFLDSFLHEENPGKLDAMYQQVATVNPNEVQEAVNQFSTRPTDQVVYAIECFLKERYLFDYTNDASLIYRVNRILKRVKLEPLNTKIFGWLPHARKLVYESANQLLDMARLNRVETSS